MLLTQESRSSTQSAAGRAIHVVLGCLKGRSWDAARLQTYVWQGYVISGRAAAALAVAIRAAA